MGRLDVSNIVFERSYVSKIEHKRKLEDDPEDFFIEIEDFILPEQVVSSLAGNALKYYGGYLNLSR
jgi:hypothetical protein